MQENFVNNKEMELDIGKVISAIFKHKKTFVSVLLFTLVIGFAYLQFSPKIYRTSILLQSPVYSATTVESAVNIKDLIVNNFFHEELGKILDLSIKNDKIDFKVNVFPNINLLEISVELETKKKVWGPDILLKLTDLIKKNFRKKIMDRLDHISIEITRMEADVAVGKQIIENRKNQIKGMSKREKKLEEELRLINENTKQLLAVRENFLKDIVSREKGKTRKGDDAILIIANFMQNNLSYLNLVNYQLSDLPVRRANFYLEIKEVETQIRSLPSEIEKLNISKTSVFNVRIKSQPKTSADPILPEKNRIFKLTILAGLFFGVVVSLLKEFLQTKGKNV